MTEAKHVGSGKVRELFEVGDDQLLLVASDRISAYDVVLPQAIPEKGKVLTGLTNYWFEVAGDICPNHLLSIREESGLTGKELKDRLMLKIPIIKGIVEYALLERFCRILSAMIREIDRLNDVTEQYLRLARVPRRGRRPPYRARMKEDP